MSGWGCVWGFVGVVVGAPGMEEDRKVWPSLGTWTQHIDPQPPLQPTTHIPHLTLSRRRRPSQPYHHIPPFIITVGAWRWR